MKNKEIKKTKNKKKMAAFTRERAGWRDHGTGTEPSSPAGSWRVVWNEVCKTDASAEEERCASNNTLISRLKKPNTSNMWGRISSMAQAVQEKLEESLGENPEDDIEATAESSPARKVRNHSLD